MTKLLSRENWRYNGGILNTLSLFHINFNCYVSLNCRSAFSLISLLIFICSFLLLITSSLKVIIKFREYNYHHCAIFNCYSIFANTMILVLPYVNEACQTNHDRYSTTKIKIIIKINVITWYSIYWLLKNLISSFTYMLILIFASFPNFHHGCLGCPVNGSISNLVEVSWTIS